MPGKQKKPVKKKQKPMPGMLGSGAAASAARAIKKKHQRLKDI